MRRPVCPECGVPSGQYHRNGCDVELCPYCGDQLVGCVCPGVLPPLDDRMPWTGVFPGEEECREFGWFAQLLPGRGWVCCAEDDPDAEPDLHRLREQAVWDRMNKRFMLPAEMPQRIE
jgi:hypothetical protein